MMTIDMRLSAVLAAGLFLTACGGAGGGSPRDQIASVCGEQDGVTAAECDCFADELAENLSGEQLASFAAAVVESEGDLRAVSSQMMGDSDVMVAMMGASEQCLTNDD